MPVAGAAVAAGGSLIGGNQAANAAQDAGNAGAQGSRDAIAAQMAFYNQNRQDNYGGMVLGNSALQRIGQMYGLDTYSGQPSWGGISMSGGETSTDRPSFLERLHDPGGLIWQQESSTTPLQFQTGGGGGGSSGTASNNPNPTTPGGPGPNPNNPGGVVPPSGTNPTGGQNPITPGTGTADFSSFYQTPDYLVRQQEGMAGLDRGAAARGRLYSGGHDADRMRFGANLGAQGFGSYLDTLFRAAGYGSNATGNVGASGNQFGAGIGQSSQNAGNARASGYAGAGQAWGDAWNGVGAAAGDLWGSRSSGSQLGNQYQSQQGPWGG